jgi:hypothetical protein
VAQSAIAKQLAEPDHVLPVLVGNLRLGHLALGMAVFTTVVGVDIDASGRRMKKKARTCTETLVCLFFLRSAHYSLPVGWSFSTKGGVNSA